MGKFKSLHGQVCNLKWAQRLKEIGVRQDTCFQWIYDPHIQEWEVDLNEVCTSEDIHCAAFTCQDFVDLFPTLFKIARSGKQWKFYCEVSDMHLENETNLADVFARILISITKNKDEQKVKELE